MLIFRNPGLIDLNAAIIMGASVKKAGSFGRFGTGLKFAVANVLKGGGSVRLFRGLERYDFNLRELEITGQMFQVVYLDDACLNITTKLGRDWQPWMVLRELGCNAIDEGGSFEYVHGESVGEATWSGDLPTDAKYLPAEDQTLIVVQWEALDTAYSQRKELFLEGEPIWQSSRLRILPGPAAHIYYRGVRVFELPKPSAFTYDVLEEQSLTEDRTLHGTHNVDELIRDEWISMRNQELISQALTVSANYHEHKLNYEAPSWGVKASREFMDAGIAARTSRKLHNESAQKVLQKYVRSTQGERALIGGYNRLIEDAFQYAIEQLGAIGLKFSSTQTYVMVDELPGDTQTLVEEGRFYILKSFTARPAREIALEMARRWVDLNCNAWDADAVMDLLIPLLVRQCEGMKIAEELVKEDEQFMEVPEVILIDKRDSNDIPF